MKALTFFLLSACALHAQIKSYDTFVSETFPPAAALTATGDDYDGDGIFNILEFAFGTDATVKNSPNAFQLDVLPGQIDFGVLRTPGVEAKLTLQFTPDLSSPWQDQESGNEFTAVKEAVSPAAGKDAYTLTLPKATNGYYRFTLSLGNTDFDEDGILDDFDMDDDNDGVRDHLDAFPNDATRSSNATPINWYTNVFNLGISVGSQKTVSLPAIGSVPLASLWGTDIYTADSSIGRAAVHAGILTIAGGEVTVEYIGNYSPYVGSTQNGITSSSYGSYSGFKFIDLDPDSDEDGTPDSLDPDDDNDGVIDTLDAFPLDPAESADSDSDGVGDNADAFPNDANETHDNDNDGIGDNADTDDDNDGVPDVDDPAPFDETITEGTLISWSAAGSLFGGGYGDIQILVLPATSSPSGFVYGTDTYWSISNVGQAAIHAGAITNAGGTIYYRALQSAAASSGSTRNGVSSFGFGGNTAGFEFIDPALDSDEDGTPDVSDAFPNDPAETADSDEDGVGNNSDAFPNDPTETADNDNDGTGDNADLDDDNDTVPDTEDAFPFDGSESADNDRDGIGNNADTDDDNDGVLDVNDAFPFDPAESVDSDSDGTGDNSDAFPNDANEQVDTDGDGIGNNADLDDDGDGIPDVSDDDPLLDVLGILASSPTLAIPASLWNHH